SEIWLLVSSDLELGHIFGVTVTYDRVTNGAQLPPWFLKRVIVYSKRFNHVIIFEANCWLSVRRRRVVLAVVPFQQKWGAETFLRFLRILKVYHTLFSVFFHVPGHSVNKCQNAVGSLLVIMVSSVLALELNGAPRPLCHKNVHPDRWAENSFLADIIGLALVTSCIGFFVKIIYVLVFQKPVTIIWYNKPLSQLEEKENQKHLLQKKLAETWLSTKLSMEQEERPKLVRWLQRQLQESPGSSEAGVLPEEEMQTGLRIGGRRGYSFSGLLVGQTQANTDEDPVFSSHLMKRQWDGTFAAIHRRTALKILETEQKNSGSASDAGQETLPFFFDDGEGSRVDSDTASTLKFRRKSRLSYAVSSRGSGRITIKDFSDEEGSRVDSDKASTLKFGKQSKPSTKSSSCAGQGSFKSLFKDGRQSKESTAKPHEGHGNQDFNSNREFSVSEINKNKHKHEALISLSDYSHKGFQLNNTASVSALVTHHSTANHAARPGAISRTTNHGEQSDVNSSVATTRLSKQEVQLKNCPCSVSNQNTTMSMTSIHCNSFPMSHISDYFMNKEIGTVPNSSLPNGNKTNPRGVNFSDRLVNFPHYSSTSNARLTALEASESHKSCIYSSDFKTQTLLGRVFPAYIPLDETGKILHPSNQVTFFRPGPHRNKHSEFFRNDPYLEMLSKPCDLVNCHCSHQGNECVSGSSESKKNFMQDRIDTVPKSDLDQSSVIERNFPKKSPQCGNATLNKAYQCNVDVAMNRNGNIKLACKNWCRNCVYALMALAGRMCRSLRRAFKPFIVSCTSIGARSKRDCSSPASSLANFAHPSPTSLTSILTDSQTSLFNSEDRNCSAKSHSGSSKEDDVMDGTGSVVHSKPTGTTGSTVPVSVTDRSSNVDPPEFEVKFRSMCAEYKIEKERDRSRELFSWETISLCLWSLWTVKSYLLKIPLLVISFCLIIFCSGWIYLNGLHYGLKISVNWLLLWLLTLLVDLSIFEPFFCLVYAIISSQFWRKPLFISECNKRFQVVLHENNLRQWMVSAGWGRQPLTNFVLNQASKQSASLSYLHVQIDKALRRVVRVPNILFHTRFYRLILYTVCTMMLVSLHTDKFQTNDQSSFVYSRLGLCEEKVSVGLVQIVLPLTI
ncbi:hypothetical protein EGW08_016472, partial [Elysia chlorotica]